MLIYNTTYHVDAEVESDFISWLREEYIPRSIKLGKLHSPRLAHIGGSVNEGSETPGESYCLQFSVESLDVLESWYANDGAELVNSLINKFGDRVAGFSTLMTEIPL